MSKDDEGKRIRESELEFELDVTENTVFCRLNTANSQPVYHIIDGVTDQEAHDLIAALEPVWPDYLFFWVRTDTELYEDAVPFTEI